METGLVKRLLRATCEFHKKVRLEGGVTLAIALLQALEDGPEVRIQLATGSDLARATGVLLATGIRR
jgi:hypothetical protein